MEDTEERTCFTYAGYYSWYNKYCGDCDKYNCYSYLNIQTLIVIMINAIKKQPPSLQMFVVAFCN
jgi:hypothetical protein